MASSPASALTAASGVNANMQNTIRVLNDMSFDVIVVHAWAVTRTGS
jgi:hypothetical protein